MGLSRLDNLLKNARGNILYVNPNDLDATDGVENQGNSLTRPFKTIQRALVEAARFSYQRGLSNDRFGQTTILLYPGDHLVDNRPGWIPDGANNYRLRDGTTSDNLPPFDLTTNFDLTTPDNILYKLNSIHGGVIIPRGTSIVGLDLRKTKIRPKYVPDPTNDNIDRSCIFRVTGSCYLWQFSMFDADPNGQCYIDYTSNLFVPNFSHHKLTCFEYADGVNGVDINDEFQTYSTDRTDLDMYYEKVGLVYGQASGREIFPEYPSSSLDIQPKIDEYRIVGPTGGSVGISSIFAGDSVTPSTVITVTTNQPIDGLDVDTSFRIDGVSEDEYNGKFVVSERVSDTQFKYQVQNAPAIASPLSPGATVALTSDTVTSASPYIFNVSLRSVYGMCGVLADGNKADGFKSMVIAQFTGIGLQKDDKAFVVYNDDTGVYDDYTTPGNENISSNSRAIFKPSYRNFHIKCINDAFIQNVSIFAIGYAEHFAAESGGDQSVTNSNSNFGSKSLVASGFRKNAFPQDDLGYITHIIPPKEVPITETAIEFNSIDVATTVGVASTAHLYLYNQTNPDVPPENVIEGFRIGARADETIKVLISVGGSVTEYSSRIVMPKSEVSSEKKFYVNRSIAGINSITNSTITLTQPHNFASGESVRIISDTGQIPDGLSPNQVYYAITSETPSSGISTVTAIKLAKTQTDALNARPLTINENGGQLQIVSRVSDKNSGDIGHPIQYDVNQGQWYVKVSSATTDNSIYGAVVSLGTTALGAATPRTYFNRKSDNRNAVDTIYRVRYVIPSSSSGVVARPPSDGFILQESNTSIGSTAGEIQTYFGTGELTDVNQQRNFRFIANARWSGNLAYINTELPHNLSVGSEVELVNIKSSGNTSATQNLGYNRTFTVAGISSSKEFTVGLSTDPGSFQNDTTTRNLNLPYFKKKKHIDTYYIYRTQESQKYISGEQDGIYYLTLLNASNTPSVAPFTDERYSQAVKDLYPQTNRDNPESDPRETKSFALSTPVGEVVSNDPRNSITKETLTKLLLDEGIGIGVTNIVSSASTSHTIFTEYDHGLNRITQVSIASSGSGYGSGVAGDIYNAKLVGFAGSVTGFNATAKITVDASGGITNIKIMDGGTAYGIGNTLAVVGVGTTNGFNQAVVTVTKTYNNVGDSIRISGVSSESYQNYNNLYRITSVPVGAANSFSVESSEIIGFTTEGIGQVASQNAYSILTGESIQISSLSYDRSSGIATVVTSNRHGLRVDNKVRFAGADQSIYNGDFVVEEVTTLNSFSVIVGPSTSAPAATGTIYAYREGVSSNSGNITVDNENLNGRMIPVYAGITTTLSQLIPDSSTTSVNIQNIENLDLNIGDYLQIDDEIVRIKENVASTPTNPIKVFRGVAGTKASSHAINSVVRKILIKPVEFRRHSIIRASAHTFEYVGFGPGNYSTALPDKQDRQISSAEELLAQSTRRDGGINFYTGMNDRGISYSGNKKLSTITGQEEIFDTPVQTVTGEDISNIPSINVTNALEGLFTRSIKVEGGQDNKTTSEFNGPVIFTNKVTSTSTRGLEANSLFLQGDSTVSRKYTVGIATPALAGNPGDTIYYENPSKGGYVGWIYTLDNAWHRFGNISLTPNTMVGIFDQIGIGTTTPGSCTLKIGAGTSMVCVDGIGVGIGTTANNYKLHVNGNAGVANTCYAAYFVGDGSGLTNLQNDSKWTSVGVGTGIYPIGNLRVGIGTSVPEYNLHLGSVGTGGTDLYVTNTTVLAGFTTTGNVVVGGALTATNYRLDGTTSNIRAGIVTATTLVVGTALSTTSGNLVGVGTAVPRAKLDIEGSVKFKTYSEYVEELTISSNVVTVDLSKAQTFTLNLTSNINQFTIINPPTGATSFTIKMTQDATGGRSVGIDTFKDNGGNTIPVYWSGGGITPIVTPTASRTDIYSFKTFDGCSTLFGIISGQNFL